MVPWGNLFFVRSGQSVGWDFNGGGRQEISLSAHNTSPISMGSSFGCQNWRAVKGSHILQDHAGKDEKIDDVLPFRAA